MQRCAPEVKQRSLVRHTPNVGSPKTFTPGVLRTVACDLRLNCMLHVTPQNSRIKPDGVVFNGLKLSKSQYTHNCLRKSVQPQLPARASEAVIACASASRCRQITLSVWDCLRGLCIPTATEDAEGDSTTAAPYRRNPDGETRAARTPNDVTAFSCGGGGGGFARVYF